MLKYNRPLSPHLLIYNPTFNLQRSIFHRFSGIILIMIFLGLIIASKFLLRNYVYSFNAQNVLFLYVFTLFLKNLSYFLFCFHFFSGVQQLSKVF